MHLLLMLMDAYISINIYYAQILLFLLDCV